MYKYKLFVRRAIKGKDLVDESILEQAIQNTNKELNQVRNNTTYKLIEYSPSVAIVEMCSSIKNTRPLTALSHSLRKIVDFKDCDLYKNTYFSYTIEDISDDHKDLDLEDIIKYSVNLAFDKDLKVKYLQDNLKKLISEYISVKGV